jgi:hypothetical protein
MPKLKELLSPENRDKENTKPDAKKHPPDYCEIGMIVCPHCGYDHGYPVSGCHSCNRSFVE